MEIERKFLVMEPPEGLEGWPKEEIEQGYLCFNPAVRVRKKGAGFFLTCKGEGLLSREEYEVPLSQKAYRQLLPKADGTVIRKTRYQIPCGDHVIELDLFAPPFAPLMMAEVEFPSEQEAMAFTPPIWFGREVTYDPAYANASLSRRGERPQHLKTGDSVERFGKEGRGTG